MEQNPVHTPTESLFAPVQRRKVEERATELIAEEMTLRELRRARQDDRGVTGPEAGRSSRASGDPAPQ